MTPQPQEPVGQERPLAAEAAPAPMESGVRVVAPLLCAEPQRLRVKASRRSYPPNQGLT